MRTRLSWLVPDVAMMAACVTLFYCLFLFQGYQKLFRDSDAGWHIRNGEAILATGQLPRSDPYSFSRAGQPWFAWEWLADIAAGEADRAAGLSGVALLYGIVIAMVTWLWFRLHWVMHGDFLLACAMAPLLFTTANIHWLARPHVFGWLFLLAAMIWVERAALGVAASGWRAALCLAAFTALWANVHGTFFLAPMIALLYAAGALIRRFFWNEKVNLRPFLWAAAISAAAGLANPYGWQLHEHVVRYLSDSELLARIGEFHSFNFFAEGATQILATVILCIGGGFLAWTRRRPEHFLLALVFGAMALRSARALPLAALVLLPVANASIAGALRGSNGLAARARAATAAFTNYSDGLRRWDAQCRGWIFVPILILAAFELLQMPSIEAATGFSPAVFPVAAYSHIPPGARLYAPDSYGGYLIYRSAGTRKVFFDGRSDFYGVDFMKHYAQLIQLRPGWRDWWESFGFTHALLPADSPLVVALGQSGWRAVYADNTALLLSRGGT
ncbi:MAG TPA: hypothetical protein VN736_04110 [Candidatus Limnocylindrales bacterium]|nr:hypothetical protein [Candidatus Limnocylindrales bacterium]